MSGFSGSYAPGDVEFLLKRVHLAATDVAEKESLIQSGQRHYSEMISDEARPDQVYMDIFRNSWERSRKRMADEVLAIAHAIRMDILSGVLPERISLCSLVRAGAPLGVLLTRALRDMGVDVRHFGVSIIRDRGLDRNAMTRVIAERGAESVIFVDGWTGKGAIGTELRRSWPEISGLPPFLVVLADPCGGADLSGSNEDWLIPTGILGANISGLISRTILNTDLIGPDDYHGYIPVDHLSDIDFSAAFVNDIHGAMLKICGLPGLAVRASDHPGKQARLSAHAADTVVSLMDRFETRNPNRIKPGIAEATRAVLRRKPHHVFLSDGDDPDLAALLHLCRSGEIPATVSRDATGPYRAVTIIAKTGQD